MDILYKCGHCYFHSAREVGIREHPKRGTPLPLWLKTAIMTDNASVAIDELRRNVCHGTLRVCQTGREKVWHRICYSIGEGRKKVPPQMEDLRSSCVVPELRMLFENEYLFQSCWMYVSRETLL